MSKKARATTAPAVSGNQEWFDREYTGKEVYHRLWSFARRYKGLIFTGAFLGMVTGGAWAPLFSVIQPMINGVQAASDAATTQVVQPAEPVAAAPVTVEATAPKASKLERQSKKDAEKYQKYIDLATQYLSKVGIEGPAATLFVFSLLIAAAVLLKMVTQYLNQYYLTKAGMRVVMDVRNAMFKHLQDQSLAFHGLAN